MYILHISSHIVYQQHTHFKILNISSFVAIFKPHIAPINITVFAGSSEIYGTASDQIKQLGRSVLPVAKDGNCMFASVAMQLKNSKFQSKQLLRQCTVQHGERNPHLYLQFFTGSQKEYFNQLAELKSPGVWNLEMGDIAISILKDVIGKQVVVIQDYTRPQYFHSSCSQETIDKNTIAIIRDDAGSHYDATTCEGEYNKSSIRCPRHYQNQHLSKGFYYQTGFYVIVYYHKQLKVTLESITQLVIIINAVD